MSEDDPRAYFMKQRSTEHESQYGTTKRGLKIPRTKSSRLPFEAIPMHAATHHLRFVYSRTPGIDTLRTEVKDLALRDHYLQTGKNTYASWPPLAEAIQEWEEILQEKIRRGYRSRLRDGELVAPGAEFSLLQQIKAHIDHV